MSYDTPIKEVYGPELGPFTFSGAGTFNIIGPRGCVGFVKDMSADVTTSIVGTSSVPEILLGISSGDSSYGRFRLGTTASNGYGLGIHRASQKLSGNTNGLTPRTLSDFSGHVSLETARIPADTAVVATLVAAVGSAAGVARVRIHIEWNGRPMAGG